jgi:hypothetical protein
MKKQAPYKHGQVKGFDKLENLLVFVYREEILQPIQT